MTARKPIRKSVRKGVYVAPSEREPALYRVTLDAQGQQLQPKKLRYAGG